MTSLIWVTSPMVMSLLGGAFAPPEIMPPLLKSIATLSLNYWANGALRSLSSDAGQGIGVYLLALAVIGTVTDTVHGWDLDGPTLYELPQAEGSLPAGTLLAAGTAWNHGDYTQQAVEVFTSTDDGVTWSYRSSCASESGTADTEGHGIWEPEFDVASNGNLVCYFSDERPSSNNSVSLDTPSTRTSIV